MLRKQTRELSMIYVGGETKLFSVKKKSERGCDNKVPSNKDAGVMRHPLVGWLGRVVGNVLCSEDIRGVVGFCGLRECGRGLRGNEGIETGSPSAWLG